MGSAKLIHIDANRTISARSSGSLSFGVQF
jgi:hypothetical protein